MFETMPAPSSTVVKSGKNYFGQTERNVTTRWILNPSGDEMVDKVVVEVTTSHNGDRKQFNTSVTWATIKTEARHASDGPGTYTSWCWGSDHTMKTVRTAPVARYSATAMQAHHAGAMEVVEQYWEQVVPVFHEAAERTGIFAEPEA